jgi:outer membrane biosynthesis protein TonB
VSDGELERDEGGRHLVMQLGDAARLTEKSMSVVAQMAASPARPPLRPLATFPRLPLVLFGVLFSFLVLAILCTPDMSELRDPHPVVAQAAIKLVLPPELEKKEEKKEKKDEKKKDDEPEKPEKVAKHRERRTERVVVNQKGKAAAPESKALKALAKLSAAGPAMGDVLARVDKLGNGPGSRDAKTTAAFSGLIGSAPVANAGLGSFGLGGGGRGGAGTLGVEILNGKGGGGIGAFGARGGYGKGGAVGGTVTKAVARNVATQGSIDREAVARVVNAHLNEVRACYERSLLRDPGLSGKVVLEWSISTSGSVLKARSKTSSLKSGAVEGCILSSLKTWLFPPAKGGVVIVSYPFLFNSVGY